jgi:putative transposase
MPWKEWAPEAQRRALVEAMLAGKQPVAELCRRFGVARQTAYKFRRRFAREGGAGLRDQSRRPRGTVSAQRKRWFQRVVQLRQTHPTWGGRKLRWLLRQRWPRERVPCERTVQRWIKQAGLVRLATRKRRRAFLPAQRPSMARRSNAVWTFDLKGWFLTGDGTKVEPLTIRDLWSRYLLWTQPLAPRNEVGVRRICRRLFRRYGRPAVIRCDRGAPFFGDGPHGFTRLSLWWWRLGIRVEFVRRGCIHNNEHEQMHQVLKAEVKVCATRQAQAHRLEQWRRGYNHRRPHDALGLQPPASRYRPKPETLPALDAPRYRPSWLVRIVQRNGEVCLPGWSGTIGRAFGHLPLGFAPCGAHRYRIYFGTLFLGHLDLAHERKLLLPHP